jgi:hypothetical protein
MEWINTSKGLETLNGRFEIRRKATSGFVLVEHIRCGFREWMEQERVSGSIEDCKAFLNLRGN